MAIEVTVLDEYEILADLERIAQEFGLINEIFETSRIHLYYSVFARVFGNLMRTVAQYVSNIQIDTCTDEALLNILIEPFIEKRNAKVSKVILTFTRRSDAYDKVRSDIYIPRGLEVETEEVNPIVFRVAESKILWKDVNKIKVPAYCTDFGPQGNVAANTLVYFKGDEFHNVSVTNEKPAYGGMAEETAFDARNRLSNYRYVRDGSLSQIEDVISQLGYFEGGYHLKEYWNGLGSVLIALDTDSDDEFQDAIVQLEMAKAAGVKYNYIRVAHVPIDLEINIKIAGKRTFDEYTLEDLEDNIQTAINLYFAQNIFTGQSINVKRMEAFILNYVISGYDIYQIDTYISNMDQVEVDPDTGFIIVEPYQRLVTNNILLDVDYDFLEEGYYGVR